MKKIAGLMVLIIVIFYNYEKLHEVLFQIDLSKNQLNYDEAYFFDLNGDGCNEEIKLESYKDEKDDLIVDLYINKKLEKKYKYNSNVRAYIYDFNKVDKYKEIYINSGDKIEKSKIDLFIYNENNKSENFTMHGSVINNDNKNGTIKIAYSTTDNSSNFNQYSKVIGGDSIVINHLYKRVLNSDLVDVEKKEAKVEGLSKEKEYTVKDKTIVYETNRGDVKAYTLSKGDKIKLVSLYDYQDNKCIKIVNTDGRYGWIKIKDKQILAEL